MLTVAILLAVLALITWGVAAMGKCPLYVSVFILCVIELLRVLPLGK